MTGFEELESIAKLEQKLDEIMRTLSGIDDPDVGGAAYLDGQLDGIAVSLAILRDTDIAVEITRARERIGAGSHIGDDGDYAIGGMDREWATVEYGVECSRGGQVYAVSDDPADAEEALPDFILGRVVRRTVTTSEWEYVQPTGGAQ